MRRLAPRVMREYDLLTAIAIRLLTHLHTYGMICLQIYTLKFGNTPTGVFFSTACFSDIKGGELLCVFQDPFFNSTPEVCSNSHCQQVNGQPPISVQNFNVFFKRQPTGVFTSTDFLGDSPTVVLLLYNWRDLRY